MSIQEIIRAMEVVNLSLSLQYQREEPNIQLIGQLETKLSDLLKVL
jgi:hypothetical protein